MKKILLICHTGRIYGGERVLLSLLSVLKKQGSFILDVAIPINRGETLKKAVENISVNKIHKIAYRLIGDQLLKNIMVLFWNIMVAFLFVTKHKKSHIDTYYSSSSTNIFGIVLAIIENKKHVWHFHEQPSENKQWISRYFYFIYKYLLRYKKNTIVFISHTQKQAWEKELKMTFALWKVIYSPIREISLDLTLNKPSQGVTLGYIGSFSVLKNIKTAIDCFHAVLIFEQRHISER